MRLVIQRVLRARVKVESKVVGEIDKGLFVLVGVKKGDELQDAKKLADKLVKLRIMSDANDKMNLSVKDTNSSILVVSQFTLYSNTNDGNRPSFVNAAEPKEAHEIYKYFIDCLKESNVQVQNGEFGAYMTIEAEMDGPVTIIIENEKQLR